MKPRLEFGDEVDDKLEDLLGLLLVNEVSHSLHDHNRLFKQRHVFLKLGTVYVFLHTRHIVDQILVPNRELCRYLDFASHPWSQQLIVPAIRVKCVDLCFRINLSISHFFLRTKHFLTKTCNKWFVILM